MLVGESTEELEEGGRPGEVESVKIGMVNGDLSDGKNGSAVSWCNI